MLALAATLAAVAAPAPAPVASPAQALPPRIVAGRSVHGRAIVAVRRGRADAPVRMLVTGSTHGTEPAGHAVVERLRSMPVPDGVQLWLVRSVNPDGAVRGTRQNARGVDLNRNFPRRWGGGGRPFDTYFPGPSAASEPETRALMRLVRRVRPAVSIHYHQMLRLVNLSAGADPAVVRAYARRVGLPAEPLPRYRGTATSWSNHLLPGTSAFVVELPGGPLTRAAAARHARAVHAVATRQATAAGAPRPPIRSTPIPFGPRRRGQMRAYARRHYGLDTARLKPRTIVQHFTATSTFGAAHAIFAANRRDPELGELPGVCAHYMIDVDGTIHRLVEEAWMCRHTIGLNHVALSIEHVGTSDAQVMGRARQLEASLALTRSLMARHGIRRRDVIGHAESRSSPYYRERVARLHGRRPHDDFARRAMRRYRGRL